MDVSSPSILAIIPARGGSVRLPRKNILPFAGKPLIAWSIEVALSSKFISKVVVSTDDCEIADISRNYGADVPFLRPAELASNTATTIDVIIHAVNYFQSRGENYDYVALLQPTSPLRKKSHIDEAIGLLKEKHADGVISVCKLKHPIEYWKVTNFT